MKKHYIFDTNILLSKKNNLVDLIQDLKKDDCIAYVTELSVQELKGQNYRDINAGIESLDKIIKSPVGQYLKLENNIDVKLAQELSDKKIDRFIKSAFEDNIIPLNIDNHKIEIILKRANEKIAPFNIESNSDKGFKDTLLWLSILDFYKDKNDFEVIFVTNDSVFKKFEANIQLEFSCLSNSKIQVINNITINKITNEDFNENKEEAIINNKFDIEEIDSIIEEFLYSVNYDVYGNEYFRKNFIIYEFMDNNDIQDFLDYLSNMLLTKYSLFRMIRLFNIFSNIDIKSNFENEIDRNVCTKLIKKYELMKGAENTVLESFIELLKEKFNSMYETSPENLPF